MVTETTPPPAVRFRVRKGAKLLFECEIANEKSLPQELQHQTVRADEMGLLRNVDITITKRLDIVEVDRMVACCRQHPPQAMVAPVSKDHAAFQNLAVYLKQRERAGVGSIGPGMLVMLIPIPHRNDFLRCQIVNTTTTVGEIGAQVSTAFAPAVDQRPPDAVSAALPSPPPSAVSPKASSTTSTTATVKTTTVGPEASPASPVAETLFGNANGAAMVVLVPMTVVEADGDAFAKLREEHAAFNAFNHHVLLEWSTKLAALDAAPKP